MLSSYNESESIKTLHEVAIHSRAKHKGFAALRYLRYNIRMRYMRGNVFDCSILDCSFIIYSISDVAYHKQYIRLSNYKGDSR